VYEILHDMVATKQMYGRKFLHQILWHFVTKNYENLLIFVKITAKKTVAPFLFGHGVYCLATDHV